MTDLLYPCFSDDYTIVDGTAFFVSSLQERYPRMKCYTSLFEDFQPNRLYGNIILGHVLEHVEDPVKILKLCSQWHMLLPTKNNGIVYADKKADSYE